ncbi:hypothetical protein M422DRAFT_177155 [Sphaerobolus stellatus SS14]|uniref:F-box domain-containing protein n=1 Tax=Sphaerobolus stellatus (strain SS14) TaxID=990650 RepID=A0A0C9U4U3_SPHS4|nr:hypothetical protein M422DRAFT_177155 [Sphaerobolus stellatus SS14]
MASSLLQLPFDILEELVSQIDHLRDLISFALISRMLRDLIVPDHIQYRYICDDPNCTKL